MKAYAKKTYGKKGDAIVKKNWDAIDIAISGLKKIDVPDELGERHHRRRACEGGVHRVLPDLRAAHPGSGRRHPARQPRSIPGGFVPTGTTKYEKRGIAVKVPEVDCRTTASSAASALWSAPTPASVPSCR